MHRGASWRSLCPSAHGVPSEHGDTTPMGTPRWDRVNLCVSLCLPPPVTGWKQRREPLPTSSCSKHQLQPRDRARIRPLPPMGSAQPAAVHRQPAGTALTPSSHPCFTHSIWQLMRDLKALRTFGDLQKVPGCGAGNPALGGPAGARGDQRDLEVAPCFYSYHHNAARYLWSKAFASLYLGSPWVALE